MVKSIKTYEDFPLDKLQLYAGIDAIATARLRNKLLPILAKEDTFISEKGKTVKIKPIAHELLSCKAPAMEFILNLSSRGIGFDLVKHAELRETVKEHIAKLDSELALDFNLNSGPQLSNYVYKIKGYTPTAFTKSGMPSTDADALAALAEEHGDEDLKKIGIRNELAALYSTFLEGYDKFVKRDGRIHPTYNLHGTSSFRITGNDPNLTQLPNDKHGYSARSLFIPSPGYSFIAADYSSAEVKILAAISRDANLLKAVREGLDFHSYTAASIAGEDYETFAAKVEAGDKQAKAKRKAAKSITFAILYGSSVKSVASSLGVTLEEAEALFNLYFKMYPGIKTYIEKTHFRADANKFVLTPFGQRRRQYGRYDEFKGTAVYYAALRNAQNVVIQSTSSTLGLLAFANLDRLLADIGGYAVCTVYDSIEMEVPIGRELEAKEIILYALNTWPQEQFPWLDFDIGVDIESGTSWGDLSKL